MSPREADPDREPRVSSWLWRGGLILLVGVAVVGLGLIAALALGWRTPTPHRPPDWTLDGADWRDYGAGVAERGASGYRLRLTRPHRSAWALPSDRSPRVSDFELELEARALTASEDVGYGLLYRYRDPSNYYLFAVGGDGYYTVALVRDGALTPLRNWQAWPHVRRGAATNRLRVRCREATCDFYVNDEFTTTVVDDTLLTGEPGLWAQTFSDPALDVAFGEMRVWMLGDEGK